MLERKDGRARRAEKTDSVGLRGPTDWNEKTTMYYII
jgi:hypothetical protein